MHTPETASISRAPEHTKKKREGRLIFYGLGASSSLRLFAFQNCFEVFLPRHIVSE